MTEMTSRPYLVLTESERREMLAALGRRSGEDLFKELPESLRHKDEIPFPAALSELELVRECEQFAAENGVGLCCFTGGGTYEHFVPSVVEMLASRGEFFTPYTPYQPEASQGLLQAFFEYQTFMCRLTGMEVSNASLYDGASSLAEAVFLALNATKGKRKLLVASTVNPQYRQTVASYVQYSGAELHELPYEDGVIDVEQAASVIDEHTAALVVQHPNYFGCLEQVAELSELAHQHGALLIQVFYPISLGLLKPPGHYDADVAVAEGQCLGMYPYLGGETLGIFTTRKDFLRLLPGRVVGMTKDREGRRGFVLTLQTREQHIRRERATSNICTNNALNALRAAIYLAVVGGHGLAAVATACVKNAHFLAERLAMLKRFQLRFSSAFFHEFVVGYEGDLEGLYHKLMEQGMVAGVRLGSYYPELSNSVLISATEMHSRAQLERLVEALEEAGG